MRLEGDQTICAIVSAMLPRFGSRLDGKTGYQAVMTPKPDGVSRALYISLDLRASLYMGEVPEDQPDSDDRSIMVHMIFERDSNYTKVWVAFDRNWTMPKPDAFTCESNHDSCWRTDGFSKVKSTYREMVLDLGDAHPDKRADIRRYNTIHEIGWVHIQYKDGPEEYRHRKVLISLTEEQP